MKTCWRNEIIKKMAENGESLDDMISSTLTADEMSNVFDDGFGGSEGHPFTVWTNEYVYFPAVYDGAEWCESVPRHPCNTKTRHVGGE